MNDKAFTDIANAVMHLRQVFQMHGLKTPASIELASHEDGDRLRASMPRDLIFAQPAVGRVPDRPDIIFTLAGVELRYPAQLRARERGGFDIV